jgi:aryl-alcohol dehydrogenase-like predicted oxidoreductase
MKYVELIPGISSSVLGFGCAPVLGSVDGETSKKAIEIALNFGINHFDLARSYGYGEAEKFVGNLLKPNRKNLIISSKFGIKANWKASFVRPLKPIFRNIKAFVPQQKKNEINNSTINISPHNLFLERVLINPDNMIKSLHQSLKELKTDYLDYFFIHEPLESIKNLDEIIVAAQTLKKEGKIRALGLSFMRSQWSLHKNYMDVFDIIQFDNSPNNPDYAWIQDERSAVSNIFFSSIKGQYNLSKPEENIAKLHTDFPQSIILVSMFNPTHLKRNVDAILT